MKTPRGFARSHALLVMAIVVFALSGSAEARNYQFVNISDLPGGPGGGRSAEINDNGDVAFLDDGAVWFYDRSADSFLNVTALTGAPANPFFLKLNNNGDIAIVENPTSARDLWLFQQATQTFTNISTLPNYPGNSQASFPLTTFDFNDNSQISFHSGDNNFGSIYVYDHASGAFNWINGKPGAATFGRENEINNLGQVLYMGFPSTYLYDPSSNTTTNINTLPGGPGPALTNLDLNDNGDVALMSANTAQLYDAGSGAFLDITAVPGWPPNIFSSSRSDLGNSGDITFWREGPYVFDSNTKRFSQLSDFPGGPSAGGTETDLNSVGEIVLTAGDDIYLATPRPYGDYDNDGDVDGGDLTLWADSYGDPVAIGTAADGSSDGTINGRDFLLWQRHFGEGVPSPSEGVVSVPEPSAAISPTFTLVVIMFLRRMGLRS
jgi:hypothetical protein